MYHLCINNLLTTKNCDFSQKYCYVDLEYINCVEIVIIGERFLRT